MEMKTKCYQLGWMNQVTTFIANAHFFQNLLTSSREENVAILFFSRILVIIL